MTEVTGILQPIVKHTLTVKAPEQQWYIRILDILSVNEHSGSRTCSQLPSRSSCIFTYQQLATGIIMHITAVSNCSVSRPRLYGVRFLAPI